MIKNEKDLLDTLDIINKNYLSILNIKREKKKDREKENESK